MIRIHERRTIARPIEETFDYMADFASTAEWDPGIERASQIGTEPIGLGSRFEVMASFAGRSVPLVYEIKEYRRPDRVVIAATSDRFDAVDTIEFRPVGEGATLVDYKAQFTFRGVYRYVAPLLRPLFDRLGTKALDGLAATLGEVARPAHN